MTPKEQAIEDLLVVSAMYDDYVASYLPGGEYENDAPGDRESMIRMYRWDQARVHTIIKLIQAGRIEDAIGASRCQDTAARDYIPESVWALCVDCGAEGYTGLGRMTACSTCEGEGVVQGYNQFEGSPWYDDDPPPGFIPDEPLD